MTGTEKCLWRQLKGKQLAHYKFRRQQPIGPYIVDFVCQSYRLIIELDGGQHLDQNLYDKRRTTFLESKGYRVLRFWNNAVLNNSNGVLETILTALHRTPHDSTSV